jgi:hypothetical protein
MDPTSRRDHAPSENRIITETQTTIARTTSDGMNPQTLILSFATSHEFNWSNDAQRGEVGKSAAWPSAAQTLWLTVRGTPATVYFPATSPILSEHRSSRVT